MWILVITKTKNRINETRTTNTVAFVDYLLLLIAVQSPSNKLHSLHRRRKEQLTV